MKNVFGISISLCTAGDHESHAEACGVPCPGRRRGEGRGPSEIGVYFQINNYESKINGSRLQNCK